MILRKIAPDKIATTQEEMLKLLEADILGKLHDEAIENQEDLDTTLNEKNEQIKENKFSDT